MNYEFPHITHIDQVRAAIAGRKEFIEAERDDYIVFNYIVNMGDTFPEIETVDHAILRECRGLIFDKDGNVLSRRLHKFFNVNETSETRLENVDLSKPHVILEKLDGSMITPIKIGDHYRWGTKMGITEVAMNAEAFVAKHPQYEKFARACYYCGLTPIFEWCSRKNQIVIDYPEDRLVLIAMRVMESGEYVNYERLCENGKYYGIEVVKQYPGTVSSMEHLVQETRDLKDAEGWIIRFDDGHMLKIKADDYVMMHRAKDMIRIEKNVLLVVAEDKADDLLPILNEVDRNDLIQYRKAVDQSIAEKADVVAHGLIQGRDMDRKTFAVTLVPNFDQSIHSIMFALYDQRHSNFDDLVLKARELIVEKIRKSCGTIVGVNKVRWIIGNVRWKDQNDE